MIAGSSRFIYLRLLDVAIPGMYGPSANEGERL
jgi:hypothetical protein